VLASWLCGLAPNLETLIVFRVLQGLVAGPLIPLSQTLLLGSYPRAKAGTALAMWSMTTLVAPVAGPLLGGYITDNISWPWIFYINIPIGLVAAYVTWTIYRSRESATRKVPIDSIGLGLLVVWIAALQIMLDKGKELDWFASGQIVTLAIVAVVGFVAFLIWELTEEHPVVDLKLFAGRNFTIGAVTMSIAYGVFFGSVVLLPLWLQTADGYTATQAGFVLAPVGILALLLSPVVGRMITHRDPRIIASMAFLLFALVSCMRSRVQRAGRHGDADDADDRAGRGGRVLLHSAGVDHAVRAAAGQDRQRVGAVELRPDHRRRVRHLDLDDALGESRDDASRASHRVDQQRNSAATQTLDSCRPSGMSAAQALAHLDRMHQCAGVRAVRRRRLLRVGDHLLFLLPLIWLTRRTRSAADAGGAH
jgi:DHA2 family multidrug resistance protein